MVAAVGAAARSVANAAVKHKKGIGLASLLGLGLSSIFLLPEIPKITAAAKEGKGLQQTLGSAVNFGKWMAIPALATCILNPVGGAACLVAGLAGFIAPSFIPEIDVLEKKDQGLSYSA